MSRLLDELALVGSWLASNKLSTSLLGKQYTGLLIMSVINEVLAQRAECPNERRERGGQRSGVRHEQAHVGAARRVVRSVKTCITEFVNRVHSVCKER